MKYIIISIFCCALFGCANYSQIYHTSYPSLHGESIGLPTFENDTLKVQYYFWENTGMLVFYITNKLNKPIYIDWKKSSYIKNGEKLDYWADETEFLSGTYSASIYEHSIVWNNANVSVGETLTYGKSKRPERTTFIAPHSSYTRSTPFYLYRDATQLALPENAPSELWPNGFNKDKTIKVRYWKMTKDRSPLTFRNFLTISTSDKFDSEFYVDNEFYVSRITELKSLYMHGPSKDNSPELWTFPYKKPDRFYLNLTSGSFKKF